MNDRVVALLLAVLCVSSVAAAPVAVAQDDTESEIVRTTTLSLTPETPGEIGVVSEYDVPDSVVALHVSLPSRATDVRTDGFGSTDTGYEWTGASDPSIRFALAVNQTTDLGRAADTGRATGTRGARDTNRTAHARPGSEGYAFVDAGPWAIAPFPGFQTGWSAYGGATLERKVRTDGPGAVGDAMVYLGPSERYHREAAGQNFTLVVPDAADLGPDPDAVLDALADAAELRVGARDDRVLMVAAPAGVGWGPVGLQYGDSAAWVLADQPLDVATNTWLHEYVHTRQTFETMADTRWLTEGTARYYAARLALEADLASFAQFRDVLERGTDRPYADVALADPATWTENAQYAKGALVAGELDRQTRLGTNGTATFDAVFARANTYDDAQSNPLTADAFLGAVESVAPSVRDPARRYTATTATPEMWDFDAHQRAFGIAAPRFVYEPAASSAFEVRGPYRNATYDALPPVVVGETVSISVVVENVGTAAGTYNATLVADDRTLDAASGELAAGDSRTVTLTGTPRAPAELRVGTSSIGTVREPATPLVTDLRVGDRAANGTYPATATVAAPADVPAGGTLAMTVNNTTVAERSFTLAPNETAEVQVYLALAAGTSRVEFGERAVQVRISESDGTDSGSGTETTAATTTTDEAPEDGPTTGTSTPGAPLGPAPVVVALLALALARRWRR